MIQLLAFVTFAFSSHANTCDAQFFTNFREQTALHFCQLSMHPSCQPPKVVWEDNNTLTLASTGATITKGAVNSLNAYGAMHVERTALLAESMKSGRYFQDKLYGRDIFPRKPVTPPASITPAEFFKRVALEGTIIGSVFFLYDTSARRCNSTVDGSLTTQAIEGGRCVEKLAYSENVQNFISRPIEEQVKIAKDKPGVCTFYQNLFHKMTPELGIKASLVSFDCKNKTPTAFTAVVEGVKRRFSMRTNNDDLLTGFESHPVSGPGDKYAVSFQNAEEIDSVSIQSGKRPPVTKTIKQVRAVMASAQETKTRFLANTLKAWWVASPVVSKCCSQPDTPGCNRPTGDANATPATTNQ